MPTFSVSQDEATLVSHILSTVADDASTISVTALKALLEPTNLRSSTISKLLQKATGQAEPTRITREQLSILIRHVGWVQADVPLVMTNSLVNRSGPLAQIPGFDIQDSTLGRVPTPLSAEEVVLVSQVFAESERQVSASRSQVRLKYQFLADLLSTGSKLSEDVLNEIYETAIELDTPTILTSTRLTRHEVGVILRLVGWAQAGVPVSLSLLERCGPTARVRGLPILPRETSSRRLRHQAMDTKPPGRNKSIDHVPALYVALTDKRRARYLKVFRKAGPIDGILSSKRVWKSFLISRLPVQTLSRIWDLADYERSGDLNLHKFVVAMYFIEGLLNKQFSTLPSQVPDHILEQAVIPVVFDTVVPGLATKDTVYANCTAPGPSRRNTRCQRKHDLDYHWVVPVAVQNNAIVFFATLDTQDEGTINFGTFLKYMEQSHLSGDDISAIWLLSNISGSKALDRDEFALSLFLMHRALAGAPLPSCLPTSFIPARYRNDFPRRSRDDGATDVKLHPFMDLTVPQPVQRSADKIFEILNLNGKDCIAKGVVSQFLVEAQLEKEELLAIWNLVDTKGSGRVPKRDFALVMYLMHRQLGGLGLPVSLPKSLRRSVQFADSLKQALAPALVVSSPYDEVLGEDVTSTTEFADSMPIVTPKSSPIPTKRPLPPLPPLDQLDLSPPSPMVLPSVSSGSPVDGELRSQILELRSMIQGLMVENSTLRESVHEIAANRDGARDEGVQAQFRDSTGTELAPPAYMEVDDFDRI